MTTSHHYSWGSYTLILLLTILVIVTNAAPITITVDQRDQYLENTPIFLTVTTTETLAVDSKTLITTTTVFPTTTDCLFYTAPTPFDLIRDPSDSYQGIGNCFPGTSIDGNDALAILTQPTPIDCTSTDPKTLLQFIALKPIPTGTSLRCIGRITQSPEAIPLSTTPTTAQTPRSIDFTGSDVTLSTLTIKTNPSPFSITQVRDYSTVNNQRVVLVTMNFQLQAQSQMQILPLTAVAHYVDSSDQPILPDPTSTTPTNLFYNTATAGAYRTKDEQNKFTDEWSHLCVPLNSVITPGSTAPLTASARLFVGEHQTPPKTFSTPPTSFSTEFGSLGQTNLHVQTQMSSFTCTFPLAIPPAPSNAVIKSPYTSLTFTVGTSSVDYNLPYTTRPLPITPPPTALDQYITQPSFQSYTTYNIPSNNASIAYTFNLYIDYPLFSPEYYTQTPLPTPPEIKYILKPSGTYGEGTTLETAVKLMFPSTPDRIAWSILTPTTSMSRLEWDSTQKYFIITCSGAYPMKQEHLKIEVRFQTIIFSPPINSDSAQTNFDLRFDVVPFTTPTGPALNTYDLLYRIRPGFLVESYLPYDRLASGDIRFNLQLRPVGYPGAHYGRFLPQDDVDHVYPPLKCWIEMVDDVTPSQGGSRARVSLKQSVQGQSAQSASSSSTPYYTPPLFKYQDLFLSNWQDERFVYGGKQLITLQVKVPLSNSRPFPYQEVMFNMGCGFDSMQPVIISHDVYSDATNEVLNGARLAFPVDQTGSYLSLYTSPESFVARTTPLMIRVTSEKQISTQYDLEILESGVFDFLKQGKSNDPQYSNIFNSLSFYDLRYYVPRSPSVDLSSQSELIKGQKRTSIPSQENLLLLPLTQAFRNTPRLHKLQSTSVTTSGADDEAVYQTSSAQDIRSGTGSLFHWLINPDLLSTYVSTTDPTKIKTLVDSFTFPSSLLDWNKNRLRVELVPYDGTMDPDALGGFPFQINCDVMYNLSKFNAVGYRYPGYNPTCGGRAVGQDCAHHHQCPGGYCDPTSYTCLRSFNAFSVISNSTNMDPMQSVFAAPPMSYAIQPTLFIVMMFTLSVIVLMF